MNEEVWDKHWQHLLDEGLKDACKDDLYTCSAAWLLGVKAERDEMKKKLRAVEQLALDGRLTDSMSVPAEALLYALGKAEVIR